MRLSLDSRASPSGHRPSRLPSRHSRAAISRRSLCPESLLSRPAILVADEPTQGVDVGARAEIYRILREVADQGVPVVIASSDTLELEGLCDRVVVMSRGHAVATFEGDDVTEERIVHAAVSASTHVSQQERRRLGSSSIARFIEGDYAPVLVLAAVMIALGAYVWTQNDRYFSDFNITSVMFACAALGFISLGQTFALLLGGIDLSVGPLAGFLVVVGSFFILDGQIRGRLGSRVRSDVCLRDRSGLGQRSAHTVRELHSGRRDSRYVHRTWRAGLHPSRRAGRLHRDFSDRRDLKEGRSGANRVHRLCRGCVGARARAQEESIRPSVACGWIRRGVGEARRRSSHQGRASRIRRSVTAHVPRCNRPSRAARCG